MTKNQAISLIDGYQQVLEDFAIAKRCYISDSIANLKPLEDAA